MRLLACISRHRIALGVALLLLPSGSVPVIPSWADDTPSARHTLKGITTVTLLVDSVTPDAEKDGLTRDQLQTDVELRLRQAGITVSAKSSLPVRLEFLRVSVLTTKHPIGVYAYAVNVDFWQFVCVRAQKDNCTFAPTWGVSAISLVGAENVRDVRKDVADYVDQFINAYLEQNSKP